MNGEFSSEEFQKTKRTKFGGCYIGGGRGAAGGNAEMKQGIMKFPLHLG